MTTTRGWCPFAERIETEAQGGYGIPPGQMQPIAVVNHIMQGFQRTMIAWAQERPARTEASAHFSIGRDGRLVQHVSIFTSAWHAGRLDSGRNPTWALWVPGMNPNANTVGIEHEGFSVAPGHAYDYVYGQSQPWPAPMVEASIRVQEWICEQAWIVPGEHTIIRHGDLAPASRRDDPGATWPRTMMLASLRAVVDRTRTPSPPTPPPPPVPAPPSVPTPSSGTATALARIEAARKLLDEAEAALRAG